MYCTLTNYILTYSAQWGALCSSLFLQVGKESESQTFHDCWLVLPSTIANIFPRLIKSFANHGYESERFHHNLNKLWYMVPFKFSLHPKSNIVIVSHIYNGSSDHEVSIVDPQYVRFEVCHENVDYLLWMVLWKSGCTPILWPFDDLKMAVKNTAVPIKKQLPAATPKLSPIASLCHTPWWPHCRSRCLLYVACQANAEPPATWRQSLVTNEHV